MRVRLADASDGERIAAIYRPAVAERVTSFELDPPSGAEMSERVTRTLARMPWLVAEPEDARGEVLGYAYASAHKDRAAYQWSVDVSAYVDASAHRLGLGRALYDRLFAILRLQGFVNAYAGITLPNAASESFHRAMGFEPVGVYRRVGYKFGAWHDVIWLSLALRAHASAPAPPRPLAEMRAEIDALLAAFETGGKASTSPRPVQRA